MKQNKNLLGILILAGVLLLAVPRTSLAQYNVTTADDLNSAVTAINAGAVSASVTFNNTDVDFSTLTSPPLTTLQYDTTLLDGTGSGYVNLTNSTLGATASLNSTALLDVSSNYDVYLYGTGSLGTDGSNNGYAGNAASMSAGSLNLEYNSYLYVYGGSGNDSTGATGTLGGNGGGASLSVSGAVTGSSTNEFYVYGGNAGSGSGTGG